MKIKIYFDRENGEMYELIIKTNRPIFKVEIEDENEKLRVCDKR